MDLPDTGIHDRLRAALADRYRLDRELGQGGMATVYLAEDLRHDRKVAIKVLRPELAAVIGADRFLSEIRTTANLQHPHILSLFDSGAADGFLFYVMPLIDGESLRERLDREKQLPLRDAVRITTEVAGALDYAHRHGVIHRDIKPENILLHDGRALVADFGIALAASRAGSASRMTETGMSLGTPNYMSPEQAMGEREITGRSDVYALGAVAYEMLTGDPPFTGSTAQAIVARVLTEAPRAMRAQRHTIPAHVEAAVLTALEKLPADRFATPAEFSAALAEAGHTAHTSAAIASTPVRTTRAGSRRAFGVMAGVAALLAVVAAWGWLRPEPPRQVVRYSMGLPPEQSLRQGILGVNVDISPDGQRIVYIGPGPAGDQLWLRERDRLDATPLTGTSAPSNPTFSPDGSRIAFTSGLDFELKVVPVAGGPPVTLAVGGPGSGGGVAWADDGWIYFDTSLGLARISDAGGATEQVIPFDSAIGEVGHAWPAVLPNGRGLLYRSRSNADISSFDLVAFDLETRERRVLTKGLIARFVEPGFLVHLRNDGAVLASPFDPDRLAITGPAVPLFEGVLVKPFGSADIAISASGTLAYVPGSGVAGGGVAEMVHVSRNGTVAPFASATAFNLAPNRGLSLSPDESRIAVDVAGTGSIDIWVKQLPDGPFSRLTFGRGVSNRPTWTPDSRSVIYVAPAEGGALSVWQRRADGSTPPELLWQDPVLPINEALLSRDGEWLIYRAGSSLSQRDIYAVRPGRDSVPTPLLNGPYMEFAAALSPDGRWLAYTSNESGQAEIYVRPFPGTASGRWQISNGGGNAAHWDPLGRSLYYEGNGGEIMAVPVTAGATFIPGEPRRIISPTGGIFASSLVPYYAATRDTQRFIMVRSTNIDRAPGAGQLIVVENWVSELEGKMRSAGK